MTSRCAEAHCSVAKVGDPSDLRLVSQFCNCNELIRTVAGLDHVPCHPRKFGLSSGGRIDEGQRIKMPNLKVLYYVSVLRGGHHGTNGRSAEIGIHPTPKLFITW